VKSIQLANHIVQWIVLWHNAINRNKKHEIIGTLNKLALVLLPIFPDFIQKIANKKSTPMKNDKNNSKTSLLKNFKVVGSIFLILGILISIRYKFKMK